MEEKKPLESRNLSHTSKEPEAQVWANIGTASYVTPSKNASTNSTSNNLSAEVPEEVSDESKAVEEPDESSECVAEEVPDQPELIDQTDQTDAGSVHMKEEEVSMEFHVDCNSEPIQRESTEPDSDSNSKKADSLEERRRKNRLGDGFEGEGEEEVDKREEQSERGRTKSRRSKSRDRSRSRDRSHDRSLSLGRESGRGRPIRESTNSTDSRKIRSRVFVGHLTSQDCDYEGIRKAFSKYGKITGINLQNGYGFVQFDNHESAMDSIKGLNQTKLFGETIVVDKPVAWLNLEKSEARTSHRALLEEVEYLRRRDRDHPRARYSRVDDVDRFYDRRDYERPAHYDYMERDRLGGQSSDRYREDRYRDDRYREERYREERYREDRYPREDRYREESYDASFDRRAERGGGYYMGQGDSYYGGGRM